MNLPRFKIECVKYAKPVLGSKPDFPIRAKTRFPFERLPIPRLHIGVELKLFFNSAANEGVIFFIDGLEMMLHLGSVDQPES